MDANRQANMLYHARWAGKNIALEYPPVREVQDEATIIPRHIPRDHVGAISEAITLCVAEILQAWLDAGSEREVTMEELLEPITLHVQDWSL